ncbi:MAG: glycine cleavage system protein H [Candidatus Heimdallarchaeota archaeon]
MSYAEIYNCVLPNQLYYNVTDDTWLRKNANGTVTIGITDIGQTLAGTVLHATPKQIGAVLKKGDPITLIESNKWVGPIKSPISGTIIDTNEVILEKADLLNSSPYNQGWLAVMQPSNLDEEIFQLKSGESAVEAYKAKMDKEDLKRCEHSEGFEI